MGNGADRARWAGQGRRKFAEYEPSKPEARRGHDEESSLSRKDSYALEYEAQSNWNDRSPYGRICRSQAHSAAPRTPLARASLYPPQAALLLAPPRSSFDSILHGLKIKTIIHPKNLTGEYIASYIRAMQNSLGSNVETLYKLNDDAVEALEFRVRSTSRVTGIPLQ